MTIKTITCEGCQDSIGAQGYPRHLAKCAPHLQLAKNLDTSSSPF